MSSCPNCGNVVRFDIKRQQLFCDYCSGEYDPYNIDMNNNAEEIKDSYDITAFRCPQCGGELYSTDKDMSGNCSYCGSTVVFESRMTNSKRPKYIIPFTVSKEDCKARYLEEVNKYKFTPNVLKDPQFIDGFRGIYVPYWIYEVKQDGHFDVEASTSHTSGDYTITDTYNISATNDSVYEQIIHDASSVMQDDISEKVEPYNLNGTKKVGSNGEKREEKGLQEFTPSFFSGFYAEPVDMDADIYEDYICSIANEKTKSYIDSHDELGEFSLSSKLTKKEDFNTHITNKTLAMLPVWFLSYKKNNRVAYAAINGQNGRLVTDMPVDFGKFALRTIITALIIFVLMSFSTSLPMSVTLISVLIASMVTRVCEDDAIKLSIRSNDGVKGKLRISSDGCIVSMIELVLLVIWIIGFKIYSKFDVDAVEVIDATIFFGVALCSLVVHAIRIARTYSILAKVNDKKAHLLIYPIISFIAALIGTGVLFIAPVSDMYYYMASIIVVGVEVLVFTGIVKNYNKIATRPLPQFTIHTGGDDRA